MSLSVADALGSLMGVTAMPLAFRVALAARGLVSPTLLGVGRVVAVLAYLYRNGAVAELASG
jgi:hypothetical protein